MSKRAAQTVCCCICHRYRAADKMSGARCIDVKACHAAAMRAAPVKVPKRVLRKQFGSSHDSGPLG